MKNDDDTGDAITASAVARWMVEELERVKHLYQEDCAHKIQLNFGMEFIYENENGNWAISKAVLKEFRKLTEGRAVWERGERMWRMRQGYDRPGRQQD